MKTVYALIAVCLVAGLALAGCACKKDKGHAGAAGGACCPSSSEKPKTR